MKGAAHNPTDSRVLVAHGCTSYSFFDPNTTQRSSSHISFLHVTWASQGMHLAFQLRRSIHCHTKRLVNEPPEAPLPRLTDFLQYISRQFPKLFFKPLFVCATANKDATVVAQLCILNALSTFVPDIFTRDADMMAVALVNDTATMSAAGSNSDLVDGSKPWGVPRIGQVALLVELVDRFQQVHDARDLTAVCTHIPK